MYNKLFEQRGLFYTTSRCSEQCDYMKMGIPKNDFSSVSRNGKDRMCL
jgi:hypothetical protein